MNKELWVDEEEVFEEAEFYCLRERGFYVQRPDRVVDLNGVPADGDEYIAWSKLQDAEDMANSKGSASESLTVNQNNTVSSVLDWLDESSLQYPKHSGGVSTAMDDPSNSLPEEGSKVWFNLAAKEFSEFANVLKKHRAFLEKKFPPKNIPDVKDEQQCCLFCLGSENFSAIYKVPCPKKKAELPLFSCILHLNQEELILLLKYCFKWFLETEMSDLLAKWTCAIFACLKKPLAQQDMAFLEMYYDACKEHITFTKAEEVARLKFISAVLLQYFCVKAYKLQYHR